MRHRILRAVAFAVIAISLAGCGAGGGGGKSNAAAGGKSNAYKIAAVDFGRPPTPAQAAPYQAMLGRFYRDRSCPKSKEKVSATVLAMAKKLAEAESSKNFKPPRPKPGRPLPLRILPVMQDVASYSNDKYQPGTCLQQLGRDLSTIVGGNFDTLIHH